VEMEGEDGHINVCPRTDSSLSLDNRNQPRKLKKFRKNSMAANSFTFIPILTDSKYDRLKSSLIILFLVLGCRASAFPLFLTFAITDVLPVFS